MHQEGPFYDQKKNLVLEESPSGNKTGFIYDECNRLKSRGEHLFKIGAGNTALLLSLDLPFTCFTYKTTEGDFLLNCQAEYRTDIEYNEIGRIGKTTVYNEVTRFFYDDHGFLVEVGMPSGYTVRREFDELFRVKSLSDAKDVLYSFTFDVKNRVKDDLSLAGKMTYRYALDGQIAKITDRLGNNTAFFYNEYGALTQVKDAESNIFKYAQGM